MRGRGGRPAPHAATAAPRGRKGDAGGRPTHDAPFRFEWPALLQMRLVWQARRGRPSHVTATETRDMLSQLSPRLGLPRCSWGCRSPVFCHRPLETGAGPPSLRGLEGAPGRRSAPPREPHAPSLPVGDGMATSQQAASSEGLRLWALLSQGRTASTRYDSLLGQAGETVRASEHRRAPVSAGGAGPRGRACGTPNPGAPPGPGGHRHHLLLPLPLPLLRLQSFQVQVCKKKECSLKTRQLRP